MKTELLKIWNDDREPHTWDVWSFKIDGKFYDIYTNIHRAEKNKINVRSWMYAVDRHGVGAEGKHIVHDTHWFPMRSLMELQHILGAKK